MRICKLVGAYLVGGVFLVGALPVGFVGFGFLRRRAHTGMGFQRPDSESLGALTVMGLCCVYRPRMSPSGCADHQRDSLLTPCSGRQQAQPIVQFHSDSC